MHTHNTIMDVGPPIGDSIMGAMDKINTHIDRLRNREPDADSGTRIPSLIQHAASEVCLEGADLLARDAFSASEVPAANLFQKYGHIQAKLAEARTEFNRTVERKFIEPFATYTGAYENANVRSHG